MTALTIVVPVKDEEQSIATFVSRVVAVLDKVDDPAGRDFEILFIDDGSTDSTLARIREAHAAERRVRAVSLSRNFGKEAALTAGLDVARGDAVVPMDVDLQDPPEVLPAMIARWREGFDVVCGIREDRQTDSLPKRLTADLYYRAHNWLSDDKIPEHAGDFRLLDRKVVEVIRSMPERNRFMKGLFAWVGFNAVGVPYERPQRAAGSSKFNLWRLWNFALDGVVSFSTAPLRAWSYLGGIVALLAIGYAIFLSIRTMIWGTEVPGYASLMVAISFLGGLQLLSLGILGEYVGRMLTEVKHRPLYVVRERIGDED